eukprot:2817577-Rhodomonas_salina.2
MWFLVLDSAVYGPTMALKLLGSAWKSPSHDPTPQEVCELFIPRNQTQESTISAHFVPGMRLLVFDFGMDGELREALRLGTHTHTYRAR